ncbi:CDP-diacylglycerol--serine O-phosphatidyltransferase [marine bacterium AO1-C]|nr:CDP-diacylglycerol--serine O-phosphatidyltransferase [marine bacterium AO1-C]
MSIKQQMPNAVTCGNVLCGCIGIVLASKGELVAAVYCMGLGMLFDFGDGLVARLLNAYSELGKQLDSLADMVTFGVLPGFILYQLLLSSGIHPWWAYVGFTLTIFSAIRLAKFNIDTRQTDIFIGLPTPAAALFVGSLPLILVQNPKFDSLIKHPVILIVITLILSGMLIANIRLFSLKFQSFGWSTNQLRYSFVIISLVFFVVFKFLAIPVVLLSYIILSLIFPPPETRINAK